MYALLLKQGKLIGDGDFGFEEINEEGQFLLMDTCFKKRVGVISNHL